jgi:RNA-binding motif protein, X-linked 2
MHRTTQISRLSELQLQHPDSHPRTPLIHTSNLPFECTEGDLLAIFSQYGTIHPTSVHLQRHSADDKQRSGSDKVEKRPGQSKGWAWLKYEDERSSVLAVDNLNGIMVGGRTISVDYYVPRDRNVDIDRRREEQKQIVDAYEQYKSQQEVNVELEQETTNAEEDPMAKYRP